jgi:hypothetical protein
MLKSGGSFIKASIQVKKSKSIPAGSHARCVRLGERGMKENE